MIELKVGDVIATYLTLRNQKEALIPRLYSLPHLSHTGQ